MKKQSKTFRLLPEVIEKIEGYDRKKYRDETDYVSKVILSSKDDSEKRDIVLEKLEEILEILSADREKKEKYNDGFL